MLKVIVKYKKEGYTKYLGHLEMVNLIERVLRRIDIPFEFSKGYNPKPQISFAAPLAVGVTSEAEYFQVRVKEKFDLKKITDIPADYLPMGMTFEKAVFSEDKKSLMAKVRYATYRVKVPITGILKEEVVREKMNSFLTKEEVIWKKIRKKKKPRLVNIMELVEKAFLLNVADHQLIMDVEVKTGSAGNLKPEIFVEKFLEDAEIEVEEPYYDIHRMEIYKKNHETII